MPNPRDSVEASFASITITCSGCGADAEIDDVEICTTYPGETPQGHRFSLPDGWTINKPENGALCGTGVTCTECNEER